jgi:hypothetical protein
VLNLQAQLRASIEPLSNFLGAKSNLAFALPVDFFFAVLVFLFRETRLAYCHKNIINFPARAGIIFDFGPFAQPAH